MDLVRFDSNPNPKPDEWPDDHRQESFSQESLDSGDAETFKVRTKFPQFGRGELKRSQFAVDVCWIDVKSFLAAFIEAEHPEAIHLNRMIRLAEAIERAGWVPSDPPPEDFGDAFPHS
jgi:hypothetical protein